MKILYCILFLAVTLANVNAQITNKQESKNMLVSKSISKNKNAPVIVLFGGNPLRRDEVINHLKQFGDKYRHIKRKDVSCIRKAFKHCFKRM